MKGYEEPKLTDLVSIRIFGVPERMDWIVENQTKLRLPDENVFIDYEHEGCVPSARKAWLKETNKPFTMVLTDDVELCDDFQYCARAIVTTHPDDIISLFPIQFMHACDTHFIQGGSPYIATNMLSGCGIIMRTDYVRPCLDSWDPEINGDDVNIRMWAEKNKIGIITTIPATIQHIGDKSVHDASRSIGRTDFYSKTPLHANWYDGYVTSWTNVVKRR